VISTFDDAIEQTLTIARRARDDHNHRNRRI